MVLPGPRERVVRALEGLIGERPIRTVAGGDDGPGSTGRTLDLCAYFEDVPRDFNEPDESIDSTFIPDPKSSASPEPGSGARLEPGKSHIPGMGNRVDHDPFSEWRWARFWGLALPGYRGDNLWKNRGADPFSYRLPQHTNDL